MLGEEATKCRVLGAVAWVLEAVARVLEAVAGVLEAEKVVVDPPETENTARYKFPNAGSNNI